MDRNPNKPHEGSIERVAKVLTAFPEMMMDQLPVQGLASLLNYLTGKADYTLKSVASGYVKQVVPFSGLARFIERIVDPDNRVPVTVVESVMADIPGLSEYVKKRKNLTGLPDNADVIDAFMPYKWNKENPEIAKKAKDRPVGKALHSATDLNADESQKGEAVRILREMEPGEARRLLREHVKGIKHKDKEGRDRPGNTEAKDVYGKDTAYGLRLMRLNQLISAAKRSR
jgi:hypothetical protein